MKTRQLPLAGLLAVALILSGCGGSEPGATQKIDKSSPSTLPEVTTTTTEPVPNYRSYVAHAKAETTSIVVYDTPGGDQKELDMSANGTLTPVSINSPDEFGTVAAFLVKSRNIAAGDETFHEVYLPVRPNQSTGYIRASDVDIFHTDVAIEIDLSDKRLRVFDKGAETASFAVAVGTDDTPTPQGKFYLNELLDQPNPTGGYGPFAYGLSGHSDAILNSDEFPNGVIGIHGTNKPELIGQQVSNGCVRMENSTIVAMTEMGLALGTPVTIKN